MAKVAPKRGQEYGDPTVRLLSLLRNLRVEVKKGEDVLSKSPMLSIKDFGIQIHLTKNRGESRTDHTGTTTLFYCPEFTEAEISAFGEGLMWLLIAAGYMAYIREEPIGSRERIFNKLIVDQGWGMRIINKRLEAWKNQAPKAYMYKRLKALRDEYSMLELIARWPGLFDFLS